MTKCTVCKIEGIPVYRTGPKGSGQDPRWTCEGCMKTPPPSDVKNIVDALQSKEGIVH